VLILALNARKSFGVRAPPEPAGELTAAFREPLYSGKGEYDCIREREGRGLS